MPTTNTLAAAAELAHVRALEVVREHGPEERVENLENITVGQATTRNPAHLVSFQAEILAAFAEIIERQERRIAELEKAAQPETPAAAAENITAEEGSKGTQKKRAR